MHCFPLTPFGSPLAQVVYPVHLSPFTHAYSPFPQRFLNPPVQNLLLAKFVRKSLVILSGMDARSAEGDKFCGARINYRTKEPATCCEGRSDDCTFMMPDGVSYIFNILVFYLFI